MKRSILIPISLLCATVAWADTINYLNSGPAVTFGPISNAKVGSSGRFNPAVPATNSEISRISILDISTNVQLQGLGEFNTVIENMTDKVDSIGTTFDDFGTGDASVGDVLSGINTLESTFDENIELLADSFYIKPGAIVSLPLTPWNFKSGSFGTFSLSGSSLTQARASILHGPIAFDINAQQIIDSNANGEELDPIDLIRTTSSLYLKQAQVFNADIAWSGELPAIGFTSRHGINAVGGLRATLIAYNLQKNLYPIKELARQATDDSGVLLDDITDDVTGGFSDFNYNVSLDAGITLQRQETLLGITLYHLNSPELDYDVLGGNCASITDANDQLDCFHAEFFASIGDITLQESHRLTPSMTVDISHTFLDNSVAVAGAIDLWRKNDLFGDQSQQLNLGLMLQPTQWYWPRLRFGYGKDLLDPEPTQLGLGLSLFNFLHIDTQITAVLADLSSDDLSTQGNALRSASASASINLAF